MGTWLSLHIPTHVCQGPLFHLNLGGRWVVHSRFGLCHRERSYLGLRWNSPAPNRQRIKNARDARHPGSHVLSPICSSGPPRGRGQPALSCHVLFLSVGRACVTDTPDDAINKRNSIAGSHGVCTVTAPCSAKPPEAQAPPNLWLPHPYGVEFVSI